MWHKEKKAAEEDGTRRAQKSAGEQRVRGEGGGEEEEEEEEIAPSRCILAGLEAQGARARGVDALCVVLHPQID